MAIAGDVVIKLAADFATFAQGMDQSMRRLQEFGAQAAETGTKVDAFASKVSTAAKALGVVALITAVVNEIRQIAQASEQAALEAERMAKSFGLTSTQVQALQVVSERTGRSMEDLAKTGKANVEWLQRITEEAQQAGLVIDSQYTKSIAAAARESEEANRKFQVLFAPAVAGTKSWVADALERMKNDLAVVAQHEGTIDKIAAILRMLTYGGGVGAGQAFRIDEFRKAVEMAEQQAQEARQRATPVGPYGVPRVMEERAVAAEKRLEDARIALSQEIDRAKKAAYGAQAGGLTSPPPPTPTATGGGGRTDADNIDAQIRRYDALAEAARGAYATIERNQGAYLEDLQRAVKVNQQVEEVVGKLAAKYFELTAAQREQLRLSVDAALKEDERVRRRLDAEAKADELERRLGDGRAARERARREREDMADTRRASPEALTRSMKQQEEQIKLTALEARRYDDTLGSLSAGFEAAAERYTRANDLFTSGAGAFDALTTAMSESLQVLVGRSDKSFGEIAASFANMLADMALRAAVSQAFKYAIGAVGGGFSAPGSGTIALAGPTVGRAYGGPVDPFRPYVVGERGPERFVPFVPGQIEPADRSGVTVSTGDIVVSTTAGSGVDPAQAVEFSRRLKAGMIEIIRNEQRPGGTLHSRAST